MGSRKKSSWTRAKREFLDTYADTHDIFAAEQKRYHISEINREKAFLEKSCQSKNRYNTKQEAESVAQDCMSKGAPRLTIYKCTHCKGWHLTSHPWE
jgi:hypothetical protein